VNRLCRGGARNQTILRALEINIATPWTNGTSLDAAKPTSVVPMPEIENVISTRTALVSRTALTEIPGIRALRSAYKADRGCVQR